MPDLRILHVVLFVTILVLPVRFNG